MKPEEAKPKLFQRVMGLRTATAFWILGLTNNYGYIVMLTAAHDILADFDREDRKTNPDFKRDCNTLSTGILLLADIIPNAFVKLVGPFLPFYIFLRMAIAVILSAAGFLLFAFRSRKWVVITGICCISFSMGLGESSLLGYMVFFKTLNVISTWASGTGGAGIFGATSYAVLMEFGLSPGTTIMLMLVIPAMQGVAFFFMVEHPIMDDETVQELENVQVSAKDLTFKEKLQVLPHLLLVYMTPCGLVYLCEYFINEGLYELLYFPDTFLDHHSQYRWYSVLYQMGVFISRSSMNLIQIDRIWLLAVLQFINVLICLSEVLIGYITFVFLLMIGILYEGLIGGAAYVHTYRKIATETTVDKRHFCMSMNSLASSFCIMLAGIIAQPTHNKICRLPPPYPYTLKWKYGPIPPFR